MPAVEPFFHFLNINTSDLTQEELFILEAELFMRIYEFIRQSQNEKCKEYFETMHIDEKGKEEMLDNHIIRFLMKDLMEKEGYTLAGIASYSNMQYDIVEQIYMNRFTNPSVQFFYRLINLHRGMRRHLYLLVLEKILQTNKRY